MLSGNAFRSDLGKGLANTDADRDNVSISSMTSTINVITSAGSNETAVSFHLFRSLTTIKSANNA